MTFEWLLYDVIHTSCNKCFHFCTSTKCKHMSYCISDVALHTRRYTMHARCANNYQFDFGRGGVRCGIATYFIIIIFIYLKHIKNGKHFFLLRHNSLPLIWTSLEDVCDFASSASLQLDTSESQRCGCAAGTEAWLPQEVAADTPESQRLNTRVFSNFFVHGGGELLGSGITPM